MNDDLGQACTEILVLLNNMEPEYFRKVPRDTIDFFKKNSDKNYSFFYDVNVPFAKQKVRETTLALLAILNIKYWCESEEEKQKLIAMYNDNERKKQDELRKKYNPDNLFKASDDKQVNITNITIGTTAQPQQPVEAQPVQNDNSVGAQWGNPENPNKTIEAPPAPVKEKWYQKIGSFFKKLFGKK
jgi:hypothetical protein